MADDPIEEELRELEADISEDAGDGDDDSGDAAGHSSGAADDAGAGADDGADLGDLEADLDGAASEESAGSLGLDSDPSEQYADLLDDGPGTDGGTSTSAPDRSADQTDVGGLLSRLFGGSAGAGNGAAADDGVAAGDGATAGDVAAADDGATAGDVAGTDGASGDAASTGTSGGLRARLAGYFSPRVFIASVVLATVLAGVGRVFVPIPLVGGAVGVWLATFLVGVVSGDGRYLESAVAGAAVGALGAVAAGVSVAIAAGATERLLAVGGVGGLVVALVGHYFGRDLRAGLVGGDDWSEPEP